MLLGPVSLRVTTRDDGSFTSSLRFALPVGRLCQITTHATLRRTGASFPVRVTLSPAGSAATVVLVPGVRTELLGAILRARDYVLTFAGAARAPLARTPLELDVEVDGSRSGGATRDDGPSARRPRALVVDNERAVGRALARVLGGECDVALETHGEDALRRIRGGERFELIVLGARAPDVGGVSVHAELVRLAPAQSARVVYFTGDPRTLAGATNVALAQLFDVDVLRAMARAPAPP